MRQYQQRWLTTYEAKAAAARAMDCAGATPTEDGYPRPIDRALIAADPGVLDEPHHDHPAGDLMIAVGSPICAVRSGTVARVVDRPHNCRQLGRCDKTYGVGVSIAGDDATRYIYCHGSQLDGTSVGRAVAAGELLMWSGNTGRSSAPHHHLGLRVGGQQVCPHDSSAPPFRDRPGRAAASIAARCVLV